MLTRRFGRTELQTTVLTLGAMRIPPTDQEPEEQARDRAYGTLRRALDVGINHIETARGYGQSEAIIGNALREGVIRRDEFILTTKIPPMDTAEEFRAALDDSLTRLNVNYVEILDIHGINNDELLAKSLRSDGALGAARRAMDEGCVGHLGFSTHAPLETILQTLRTGEFETMNLHYYLMNRRNLPAVELAAAMDIGVFIISPTDKGGQLFRPPDRLRALCEPRTPIALNQRWLLSQPAVHTLSLGAANPEELDAHLEGVASDDPLSSAERLALERLDEAMEALGAEYCSYCHECLPCPERINIPEALRLRNLAVAYDMVEFGRYRYGMLARRDPITGEIVGGADHWLPGLQGDYCTACGDCLPRCPMKLDIPALLADTHTRLTGQTGRRLWK
ncbi:MAG: aldo/keto reductase [Chthonomonadales bacterium]|nr:aldo/keto reductase [Chthonomonadales bacterium]